MSPEELRRSLFDRMFAGNLVENRWRGDLVEEIVNQAIDRSRWRHCSGDWNSWDFEQLDGPLKVQVKQAALRQTWTKEENAQRVETLATVRFGIRKAKGYYVGNQWRQLPTPARIAEIYLFAFHPGESSSANHWDAKAWRFYGLREQDLPDQASLSLCDMKKKAERCGFADVGVCCLNSALSALAAKTAPNGRIEQSVTANPDDGDAEAPGEA